LSASLQRGERLTVELGDARDATADATARARGSEEKLKVASARVDDLTAELTAAKDVALEEAAELRLRADRAYGVVDDAEQRSAAQLTAQSTMGARWREENRSNLLHFQRVVGEQQEANAALTVEKEHLLSDAAAHRVETQQLQSRAAAQAADGRHVRQLLDACERRLETTVRQVAAYQAREPQLVQQCAELTAALDRANLSVRRSERERKAGEQQAAYRQKMFRTESMHAAAHATARGAGDATKSMVMPVYGTAEPTPQMMLPAAAAAVAAAAPSK
jgi:septal ring factor EnvC (AmiA/AmiB activator)